MRNFRKKGALDLEAAPPPDLAIEIDNKSDSEIALPNYASLAVPEVWRYDVSNHTLWFGRLEGAVCIELTRSVALPRVTPELVLHALDVYDLGEMGENAWFDWIKAWARERPEAPANG